MKKTLMRDTDPDDRDVTGSNDREPDHACLNCGDTLAGDFCSNCGQAASVEPYKLTSIVKEAYDTFRKIDLTKTLVTSWELIRRPGTFVRGYLEGKRVGYLSPVRFFFYAFVANFLVMSWVRWFLGDDFVAGPASSNMGMQILDLASTIFWGLLWRLFYPRSGLNAAECAVAALFFQAQTNFLSIALFILFIPMMWIYRQSLNYLDYSDFVIMLIYAVFFAMRVFRESFARTITKQIILTALFLLMIYGLILLIAAAASTIRSPA